MRRLDFIGVAFFLTSIAFCIFGFSRLQSNTEDVLQWLPDQSDTRAQYNVFQERFGGDDFVIVTWDGCTTSDPRLKAFADSLRANDPESLLQSVTTGEEVVRRLVGDMDLSRKEVLRRMRGVFFGAEDPQLTCTSIELSEAGTANRSGSMQLVWTAVDTVPDLVRDDLAVGGYPYIATFIDAQLKNSFSECLLPSVVLATLVSLLCLRHFGLTMIVFVVAVGASAVSIAFVPVCGEKFGGLMSIIPALVFVLATSGCIHLTHYSLAAIGDPRKLLAIGWRPCTVSAVTTAVGMLSLTRSTFPAIRNFGFFCAAGVCLALLFQLLVVPWLLYRFGQPGLRKLAARHEQSFLWQRSLVGLYRGKLPVSLISLLLMVLGAVGVTKLTADVEVENLFRHDSEIFQSLTRLEERLGPLDQTELLVVFDDVDPDKFSQRLDIVRRVQGAVTVLPGVGVAYSLVNFLPNKPRRNNFRSMLGRDIYRGLLQRERDRLANSGLLHIAGNQETWRISLRFPFTQEQDFGELAEQVKVAAGGVIEKLSVDLSGEQADVAKPNLIYTGKTHLFHHAQTNLLADLFSNFMLAFVVITPLLIFVLRSFWLGMIAMLPNLFPVLIVFGGMGWSNSPVDLAIAMTACVALGIAVDDTTHFLVRFRDFGGSLSNIDEPLSKTYVICGPAMLHTTMIGGVGLIVYYFSQMLVVSRFSWAITLMLVIALLADVIMLPAILFLFVRKRTKVVGVD